MTAAAPPAAWDSTFVSIEDGRLDLAAYRGHVLLVVETFCEATFGVEFPMAGLCHVRRPQAHPSATA